MSNYPKPEPRIVIAGEEDELPALTREVVAAIDRLTAAVERLIDLFPTPSDL